VIKLTRMEADEVLPGDISAGDVISLPGDGGAVRVRAVRLGHGGFQLTVGRPDSDGPAGDRIITLPAHIRLRRHRLRRPRAGGLPETRSAGRGPGRDPAGVQQVGPAQGLDHELH
jgi:hypothetical protein